MRHGVFLCPRVVLVWLLSGVSLVKNLSHFHRFVSRAIGWFGQHSRVGAEHIRAWLAQHTRRWHLVLGELHIQSQSTRSEVFGTEPLIVVQAP